MFTTVIIWMHVVIGGMTVPAIGVQMMPTDQCRIAPVVAEFANVNTTEDGDTVYIDAVKCTDDNALIATVLESAQCGEGVKIEGYELPGKVYSCRK